MEWFVLHSMCLMLFVFPSWASSLVPLCNHDDSSALLEFKNSVLRENGKMEFNSSYNFYSCATHNSSSYPKTKSWKNGTNCCLWDGVSCDTKSGYVVGLDLTCGSLQGKLHPNSTLFHLHHLQKLNLAFNDFSMSHISSGFGNLKALTHLNLSYSSFHGVISSKISRLSKLVSLDLSWLDEMIFEQSTFENLIKNTTDLKELSLDDIDMSSITPSTMSLLANYSASLVSLSLKQNKLQGKLASNMLQLPNLQFLKLASNFNLKSELSKFNWSTSLVHLDLSNTSLSGVIPPFLGNITQLTYLDLSTNNFRGEIPDSSVKNFKGMVMTNVNDGLQYMSDSNGNSYYDSVVVTIKGFDLELKRILTTFTTLDLSNNKFEEEIPTIIGELKSLKGLNLSYNKIIGPIPRSFGGLENLEWLDLSSNKLTGEIPKALINLYFLSKLNLSLNQLEGIIPSGNQFNSFQNDSYKGNSGLCGLPLSKPCHKDEEQPRDSSSFKQEEEFLFGWKAVAIGYAIGMIFGILLGYIVFLIEKPQWVIWFVEDIACLIQMKRKRRSQKFRANKRG